MTEEKKFSWNFPAIGLLAILSGIFGRMGGSGNWPRQARIFGCSLLTLICIWLLFGFQLGFWWAYLTIFGLSAGLISTYWDFLFGFDNMWFSGFMVGLAAIPYYQHYWFYGIRAVLLALIWGCLNKYLPQKVLFWTRDIVEEFLRYFATIVTLPLLLI